MSLKLEIGSFIAKNLVAIHSGTLLTKGKSTFMLAASFSPVPFLLDHLTNWTITNSEYVIFVLGAIALDHVLGTVIHLFKLRDFTFKKNIVGLIIKIGLVLIVGFLFEGINHIVKGDNVIKEYLIILLRLLVFMYPAGSAFINSSIITDGKFPPMALLQKFTKFQENLDLKGLINKEK